MVSYFNSALIFALCITVANTQNYCAANLCRNGLKHIACGNNGNFAPRCPRNARMLPITANFKQIILNMHNSNRNLIAGGRLNRYKPAARMATMQWDNELSRLAALNVKQCIMKHDKCRNTQRFSKSGQNLAIISYTGRESSKSNNALLRNRINAFWREHKNANMNIINKFPTNHQGPAIGHFTAFVAEKNIRVGCAATRFKDGQFNRYLIACNYATTNIIGQPVYQSGRTASKCTTGKNPKWPNLCSVNEKYSGL